MKIDTSLKSSSYLSTVFMCHYTSAQAFCSHQGFKDNYDGIIFCLLANATWMWNDLMHEDAMGENETRVNKWHGEVSNETCCSHQMRQSITTPCSDGCDISFNKCIRQMLSWKATCSTFKVCVLPGNRTHDLVVPSAMPYQMSYRRQKLMLLNFTFLFLSLQFIEHTCSIYCH